MKKVLLATTALMLTAGYAAAEVEVTGGANMGVKYIEDAADELTLHYEIDFNVVGSGATDTGLEFGASLDLDLDDGATTNEISDPEVFISGAFGTLTVGGVDAAMDSVSLGFSDVGFDGIGIDDDAEIFIGAGSYNVAYEGSFADFTIVVSMSAPDSSGTSSEDYSVALEYSFGDITVAGAVTQDTAGFTGDDETIIAVGAEGSTAGFGWDVFYHQNDEADAAGYGASVDYTTGPWTFIAAVGATDVDDDGVDFGVGAEYDLGGGATLAGGIGLVDDVLAGTDDDELIVADFGINLSF